MKEGETPRIGVYVCHCGLNIAGVLSVKSLAEYAGRLPNVVVSRDYKYMCSDPGQELIRQDIREHGLNRVVVAACSPFLHEETFRRVCASAGVNPYFYQMVNIREHAAWVHSHEKEKATRKAEDLIRAGVARAAKLEPVVRQRVPIHPAVLVVGGGIAGIQAALTLADAGKKVYLVEREPTIGGHMAQFDKTFPTLDCAACILTPKMTAVGNHPNITLWTYSDVVKVDGSVGHFTVTVRRRPRYVHEDLCIGCLLCIESCIYPDARVASEFDLGLGKRKPVYIPFPQAVPMKVVFDPETCIAVKTGKCTRPCVDVCGVEGAIDFEQKEEFPQIEVGTIILATGFKTFDPHRLPFYGYGRYPAVYTSLEVERLLNASGPTGGEVVLRNGKKPEAVGIVHCIGSRDENTNRYCSRVCCMYAMKIAHLIRERTGAEVYNFYIDIRAPGKGFEEFYDRVQEEGVHFIRGKVGDVTPETPDGKGRVVVSADDTLLGRARKIPLDMLVLAVGLEAQADANEVRRLFNITCSEEGFFVERHPKLAPVNTFTDGVFLAGCCQSPKDIPDSVAQAGAAAAEALALIDRGEMELSPNFAYVSAEECSGCKTCVPLCPYSAITLEPEHGKAVINQALCKGCGVCVAACPSGSIGQHLFEDAQIFDEIEALIQGVAANGEGAR